MLAGVLVFDRGETRFCYRVAAVILDRGRVLLQAVEAGPTFETPFYCLPGGRVEHGETAEACLRREMHEELEDDVEVGRLLWVIENFFQHEGMNWHEIGLYFLASLAADARLLTEPGPHYGVEPEAGIKFRLEWHDVTQLDGIRLLPSFLRRALVELPERVEHVVHYGE
jgi:ADP-ribose pyrophosphatase YjhB (NUDIX family)